MSITIKRNILTNNDCYKSGRTRTPVGMQLHTIGTAQNSASALASYWNQGGISACVHYCIDAEHEGLVYQFLPENYRSWSDGGEGNATAITVELMESDYMRYTSGSNYVVTDEAKFKADVTRAYNTAVEFFAMKCKEYGWNPQEKRGNGLYRVFSHDEGRRLGLSTAHVDPTHIWDRYGWTMDKFRADVVKAMGGTVVKVEEADEILYRVRKSWADSSSQIGAFKILENAKANCSEGYSVFDENGKAVYTPKGKDITELTGKDLSGTEAEKIAKVAPIYQKVMRETGMLASVGLAQFALESGFGTTDLALKANNFHGMKCSLSGNTWDGSVWDGISKYGKYSPEVYNGVTTNVYSEFRAYPSIYKSVQDRAAYFIGAWLDKGKTQHRYPNINKIKDAETQVKLIKANNFATDPNYVSKLLNIIERFNLTQYDKDIQPEVWSKDDTEVKVLPDTAISYYRVAKAYKDGKYIEQLGAYTNKDNAINGCPDGYSVFDPNGKIIYPKSTTYLVRCGYSSVYLKALVRRNKVRKAGFDAVIKKMDGKYIIQCGLFKNRENAVDLTNKIRKAGFGAAIVELIIETE